MKRFHCGQWWIFSRAFIKANDCDFWSISIQMSMSLFTDLSIAKITYKNNHDGAVCWIISFVQRTKSNSNYNVPAIISIERNACFFYLYRVWMARNSVWQYFERYKINGFFIIARRRCQAVWCFWWLFCGLVDAAIFKILNINTELHAFADLVCDLMRG